MFFIIYLMYLSFSFIISIMISNLPSKSFVRSLDLCAVFFAGSNLLIRSLIVFGSQFVSLVFQSYFSSSSMVLSPHVQTFKRHLY